MTEKDLGTHIYTWRDDWVSGIISLITGREESIVTGHEGVVWVVEEEGYDWIAIIYYHFMGHNSKYKGLLFFYRRNNLENWTLIPQFHSRRSGVTSKER